MLILSERQPKQQEFLTTFQILNCIPSMEPFNWKHIEVVAAAQILTILPLPRAFSELFA